MQCYLRDWRTGYVRTTWIVSTITHFCLPADVITSMGGRSAVGSSALMRTIEENAPKSLDANTRYKSYIVYPVYSLLLSTSLALRAGYKTYTVELSSLSFLAFVNHGASKVHGLDREAVISSCLNCSDDGYTDVLRVMVCWAKLSS